MIKENNDLFKNLIKDNNEEGFTPLQIVMRSISTEMDWQFVQKYIMANTVYPKQQVGLRLFLVPNQIISVLNIMTDVFDSISSDTSLFQKLNLERFWKRRNL